MSVMQRVGGFSTNPEPAAALRVEGGELPTDFRPTEFVGDRTAGIGPDGGVYLMNVTNGERRQVTNDGHPKIEAVISGDYVAWTDQLSRAATKWTTGAEEWWTTCMVAVG